MPETASERLTPKENAAMKETPRTRTILNILLKEVGIGLILFVLVVAFSLGAPGSFPL